LCTTRLLMYI